MNFFIKGTLAQQTINKKTKYCKTKKAVLQYFSTMGQKKEEKKDVKKLFHLREEEGSKQVIK